ncbi:MAG: sulfocyanin-like copper-binding protein [Actinomycetes bacterium]
MTRLEHRLSIAVTVAVAVTLLVATAALGRQVGSLPNHDDGWHSTFMMGAEPVHCSLPTSDGPTVTVTLSDMGMGPMWRHGVMRLLTEPPEVGAGRVTLRIRNLGAITHELLVLPLAAGQAPGELRIGADGTVSEIGALGEARATCPPSAVGEHDIVPGGTGVLSLQLAPGRYELVCNRPGHYGRGMFGELVVG